MARRRRIDMRTRLLLVGLAAATVFMLGIAGFGMMHDHDLGNLVVVTPPLVVFGWLIGYVYRMRHDAATLWLDAPAA